MQDDQRATRTEALWRDFSRSLRNFLRARLPDEVTTDDVLQNVFLKVHSSIHTLREDDRVQSWLYQIARNATADHFRESRGGTGEELSAAFEVFTEESSDEAEQKLALALREMIDVLPPRYRDAIFLTEIEGVTQAEMARRLEVSLSGGKSRVQRGREKLKDLLLDCCHVELDSHGKVIGYEKRNCCVTTRGEGRDERHEV